ncbi:MAG TPA: hypothetical protein VEA38_18235, partial [Terriglobales bacterium]|nr:hypothetical protein [Terriglobales bacterium]
MARAARGVCRIGCGEESEGGDGRRKEETVHAHGDRPIRPKFKAVGTVPQGNQPRSVAAFDTTPRRCSHAMNIHVRHLFAAVVAATCLPAVQAAAPTVIWGVTTLSAYGGVSGASPMAAADDAGNVYVLSTQGDRSSGCMVTLKYRASDGAVAWRREACGSFFTFGRAIAVDAAGDVVVAGSTGGDTRIVKYAGGDGAVRWDRMAGNPQGHDSAHALALDSSGDVYVLGTVALPDVDLQVMRLSGSTGATAWTRTIDNGAEETPAGIAVDSAGGVLIASHFLGTRGHEDWHVAKLSAASGSTSWQRNVDSGGRDVAVGLAVDGAGNAYVVGNSAASASLDVVRTMRFNATDGGVAWERTYGTHGFNGATAIRCDGQGNAVVTGHAAVSTGDDDIVTLKYTASGSLAWQSRFRGTRAGLETGRSLAVDPRGNVAVTGISFTQGQTAADVRTVKYDGASGGELWSSAYRGSGAGSEDSGFAVLAAAGAIYTVGVATESGTPAALRVAKLGDTAIAPAEGVNVQGLWWNGPAESGWGVNLTQQGGLVFATWFTYDAQGQGTWLVMSRGERIGGDIYAGDLYRTQGPPLSSARFDPALVRLTPVGRATFAFTDANNGRVDATVEGIAISKRITRQAYASSMPTCTFDTAAGAAPNYQALWWASPAGVESGWGLNLTHQGDILFATWFTYGADGRGRWLVGSNVARTAPGRYEGTLYRTTGPSFAAATFD